MRKSIFNLIVLLTTLSASAKAPTHTCYGRLNENSGTETAMCDRLGLDLSESSLASGVSAQFNCGEKYKLNVQFSIWKTMSTPVASGVRIDAQGLAKEASGEYAQFGRAVSSFEGYNCNSANIELWLPAGGFFQVSCSAN